MKNLRINFLFTLLILTLFACDKKESKEKNPLPDMRGQLIGTYTAQEEVVNGKALPPYTITIDKAETTAAFYYVNIKNIGNSGTTVKATVIQSNIAVTQVPVNAVIHGIVNPTITMAGSFNQNTLNFNYTIQAGGKSESVDVVATKTQ